MRKFWISLIALAAVSLCLYGCSPAPIPPKPTPMPSPSPTPEPSPSPSPSPSASPTPYTDAKVQELEKALDEATDRYGYYRRQQKGLEQEGAIEVVNDHGQVDPAGVRQMNKRVDTLSSSLDAIRERDEARIALGMYLVENSRDRERGVELLQLAQENFRDSDWAKKAQAKLRELGVEPREPRH